MIARNSAWIANPETLSIAPDHDRFGRREARTLEESDAQRDARRRRWNRESDEPDRELQQEDRAESQRVQRRAQRRERLGDLNQRRDGERQDHPRPVGPAQLFDDRVQPDVRDARDHHPGPDPDQSDLDHGSPGDAPERLQCGLLDPGGGRRRRSERVQVHLFALHQFAGGSCERGRLQVREQTGERLGVQLACGNGDGWVDPDDERARCEELRPIGVEISVGGHGRRSRRSRRSTTAGPERACWTTRRSASSPPCAIPARCIRPTPRQSSASISSVIPSADDSGSPSRSTTRRASLVTGPAATTGRTGTSARSASNVTKASCSTC